MTDKHLPQSPTGEFIMFASSDGRVRVECHFESYTIWLSQAAIAELYDKDVRTINEHLINTKLLCLALPWALLRLSRDILKDFSICRIFH